MKNFRFINTAILFMALFSLFLFGCNKDKGPTIPEKEEIEKPWTTTNATYTPANFEDHALGATIYQPTPSNGIGIILAHANTGNRSSVSCWAESLASHGYVAMAIDYQDFEEGAVYPKPVRTFKLAVEFLRRNAVEYGITAGKIVGFGQSEGAMHWGQSIIWDNDDGFFQTDPTISDKLDAAVLLYGIYDTFNFMGQAARDSYPSFWSLNPEYRSTKGNCIANVSNIDTPVLLIQTIPDFGREQAVQFHDSLVVNGKTSNLILFEDESLSLGFDIPYDMGYNFSQAGLVARDSVLAYLERTLF